MPIHDWTRMQAGDFHDFHQGWIIRLRDALNQGPLPPGYMAMAEQVTRGEPPAYAEKADRVVIRHGRGRVVAIIEIVPPGNKSNRHALRSFVEKAAEVLRQGINLLIVDLFPPTARDPRGIHKAIWDEVVDEPFEPPADKPLTVAAYLAGQVPVAYVEPVGIGDALPSAPVFLSDSELDYIPAPLEVTYNQAWVVYPEFLKEIMESRVLDP